jgi:DNA-binding beta-propeller fold protein YncE
VPIPATAPASSTSPSTPQLEASIALDFGPGGIAVSPDGRTAYIAPDFNKDTAVRVLDIASRRVTGTITVQKQGYLMSMALSQDGKTLAVVGEMGKVSECTAGPRDGNKDDCLSVLTLISTEEGTITATIPLQVRDSRTLSFTTDGKGIYIVSDNGSPWSIPQENTIIQVDLATHAVQKIFSNRVGQFNYGDVRAVAGGVAAARSGWDNGELPQTSIIDLLVNGRANQIRVPAPIVSALAVSSDGRTLYATGNASGDEEGGFLAQIDVATARVTRTATTKGPGESFNGAVVTRDGSRVFIAGGNYSADAKQFYIYSLDTRTFALTASSSYGIEPWQVALTPDESRLLVLHTGTYATDTRSASLSIIKL